MDTQRLTTLQLIARSSIVSDGTLRFEDIIPSLLDEHISLGFDYPPEWLDDIEAIRTDGYGWESADRHFLFFLCDALTQNLNDHAPDGCYLCFSDFDGALLIWHMGPEAQAQLIRDNGGHAYVDTIPGHWLSAVINGDESVFDDYDDVEDYQEYQRFCDNLGTYSVTVPDDSEPYFGSHDYGLPGEVVDVICYKRH